MTVSIWQIDENSPKHQTDVAVIGAGLVGCTAAVLLSELNFRVTLVEASEVGLGASSRNAGFMLTGLDLYYHQAEAKYGAATTREIWQETLRTHTFWKSIAQEFNVPVSDVGSLLLAENDAEAQDLEQAARRMDAEGFDCEFLSHDPLNRGYVAAIRQPGDGGLHPYALTQGLFQKSGAQLLDNNPVYKLESGDSCVIVHSRRATIEAQYVLICTNAYALQLDDFFRGKVIPTRAQCLATAPLAEPVVNAVGYSDYGYMYYRDLPDGGLLLGGGRKHHKAAENDTWEDRTTDVVQGTLNAYLKRYFPDVTAPIIRRWAGIMGFTPDGLPLVGTLPHDKRISFGVGLNGHGLSLGMTVAERAVNRLVQGQSAGVFDAMQASRYNGAAQ